MCSVGAVSGVARCEEAAEARQAAADNYVVAAACGVRCVYAHSLHGECAARESVTALATPELARIVMARAVEARGAALSCFECALRRLYKKEPAAEARGANTKVWCGVCVVCGGEMW